MYSSLLFYYVGGWKNDQGFLHTQKKKKIGQKLLGPATLEQGDYLVAKRSFVQHVVSLQLSSVMVIV